MTVAEMMATLLQMLKLPLCLQAQPLWLQTRPKSCCPVMSFCQMAGQPAPKRTFWG